MSHLARKRLQSRTSVAVVYARRRAAGLCYKCGGPRESERTLCAACRKVRNECNIRYQRSIRKMLRMEKEANERRKEDR